MQAFNDQVDKTKKKKFKKMKQMITDKLKNINDEDLSDSEQVDLSVDLRPIKEYIDDKEEMIEQMFTSLGPTLIQNMISPLLRTVPIHELKADCLIQLLGMSKKRIFTVLDGKELQSSSDSDIESDSSDNSTDKNAEKQVKARSKHHSKKRGMVDADNFKLFAHNEEDLDSLSLSEEEPVKLAKKRKSSEKIKKSKHKHSKLGDILNGMTKTDLLSVNNASSNDDENDDSCKNDSKNGTEDGINPKKGQTLLEILELEMRAKAIRSLLNQNSSSPPESTKEGDEGKGTNDVVFDENIKIKQEKEDDIEIIQVIAMESELEPKPTSPKSDAKKDSSETTTESSNSAPESAIVESSKAESSKTELSKAESSKIESSKAESSKIDSSKAESSKTDNLEKNDPKSQVSASWTDRYLENKDTEKLIKTSKMCTNIRKRMRLVRSMKQMQQEKVKVEIPVVIGSISEYQKLIGCDLNKPANQTKDKNSEEVSAAVELQVEKTVDSSIQSSPKSSLDPNLNKIDDIGSSDVLEIDVPSTIVASLDSESIMERVHPSTDDADVTSDEMKRNLNVEEKTNEENAKEIAVDASEKSAVDVCKEVTENEPVLTVEKDVESQDDEVLIVEEESPETETVLILDEDSQDNETVLSVEKPEKTESVLNLEESKENNCQSKEKTDQTIEIKPTEIENSENN